MANLSELRAEEAPGGDGFWALSVGANRFPKFEHVAFLSIMQKPHHGTFKHSCDVCDMSLTTMLA
jgi:hypothetical protein